MTWFENLLGFTETSGDNVRSKIRVDGNQLTSLENNRSVDAGEFTTPVLQHLRDKIKISENGSRNIRVRERVADVRALHQEPENESAVFQVASQFNCLEMAAPHLTPEDGVGIYQNDLTQGPACCICAGGGTIYRNYFVNHNGKVGQSTDNQIDCLASIARHFDNDVNQYWRMQNGYCFPNAEGLAEVERQLSEASESELNEIRGKLMVGVQSKTEVTLGVSNHCVTQVFCSALPITYSDISSQHWNHFPRLILDATYELTFFVALQNLEETGCGKLYLTLVGGGVFGNRIEWILSSIFRSLKIFANSELDVKIISYGASNSEVANLVERCNVI